MLCFQQYNLLVSSWVFFLFLFHEKSFTIFQITQISKNITKSLNKDIIQKQTQYKLQLITVVYANTGRI